MNCYLSRNYKGLGSAGNKAKTDMEKIMKDMNFRNVGLPQSISKKHSAPLLHHPLQCHQVGVLHEKRRQTGVAVSF